MDTIYDWVSLAIFAGLIVLFLQRATSETGQKDVSLFYYLVAGIGAAAADVLGDHGQPIIAIAVLAATVGFIIYFLKPFQRPSPRS